MEYKEHEVLDILKSVSDNPEKILLDWNINKANTPIDLKEWNYPYFIYSFPIILDNEEVATITLVSLYGGNLNSEKPGLMQKYFGHQEYEKSWWSFSHDTYLDCYLTVHKEFTLPEIVKGLSGKDFVYKDSKGKDFKFKVSYGDPESEENTYLHYIWVDGSYRFNNGVSIKIDKCDINGWSLGEKINENIKKRIETK